MRNIRRKRRTHVAQFRYIKIPPTDHTRGSGEITPEFVGFILQSLVLRLLLALNRYLRNASHCFSGCQDPGLHTPREPGHGVFQQLL